MNRSPSARSRVVDQAVEPAKGSGCELDRLIGRVGVRNVGDESLDGGKTGELASQLFEPVFPPGYRHDPESAGSKSAGNRIPDSGAGTSHQDYGLFRR